MHIYIYIYIYICIYARPPFTTKFVYLGESTIHLPISQYSPKVFSPEPRKMLGQRSTSAKELAKVLSQNTPKEQKFCNVPKTCGSCEVSWLLRAPKIGTTRHFSSFVKNDWDDWDGTALLLTVLPNAALSQNFRG